MQMSAFITMTWNFENKNVDWNRKKWENSTRLSEEEKHTDRGLAISIAACEDRQVAADTSVRDSFTSRYLCLFLLMDTEVELIPSYSIFQYLRYDLHD